jgi:N6-L-threonylcarbamoyladenine synthase
MTGKPIIPVNHVLAHMYANFLNSHQSSAVSGETENSLGTHKIVFPAISLVVSGGHTELFLMKNEKDLKWLGGTIDDAAGEAFDKTARLLGFGHGGGLAIQDAARKYSVKNMNINDHIKLPRPLMHDDTLNFSFSGLKTAVMREWKNISNQNEQMIHTFAYEVQEAITEVLVTKTIKAAELHNAQSILISGGVASNLRLRKKFHSTISQSTHLPIQLFCPSIEFCTDNAAYIGSYAYFRGTPTDWHEITAVPDLRVEI